ncbi:MAG: hypothetical protein ABL907_01650 [Hyphomicrobium sp.]
MNRDTAPCGVWQMAHPSTCTPPCSKTKGPCLSAGQFVQVSHPAAVSDGRNGSDMPAWKQVATKQQMADVSEYVFQTFIIAKPVAAAPR